MCSELIYCKRFRDSRIKFLRWVNNLQHLQKYVGVGRPNYTNLAVERLTAGPVMYQFQLILWAWIP